MKREIIFIIAILAIVLTSCSKSDNTGNTQLVAADFGYIPFYPGNYWVYDVYQIDTLGNETLLNHYDSVAITGTEMLNNIPYIVFEGTFLKSSEILSSKILLRDSLGYIVDSEGKIHFSDENFSDTLVSYFATNNNTGDTLYKLTGKMEHEPSSVIVPAGDFETLNFMETIFTYNPPSNVPEIRYQDKLYSKNIGMVLDTYHYLGSPTRFERRLKHYYVDKNSAVHK